MPELPEVDAIAGQARKYAPGNSIRGIHVLRGNGKYLNVPRTESEFSQYKPGHLDVVDVYRRGKQVVMEMASGAYVVIHNAMTGYLDWDHEPWTFDYVEGERESTVRDVRVQFHFKDGKILRFHDARLFGSVSLLTEIPQTPPELLATPNGMPTAPIMTAQQFYEGLSVRTPVKVHLMDQGFLAGIGNIYSVEALHVAGIDPKRPANQVGPDEVSVLHASLRWSVDHCFPQVRYDWLNVYRRTSCGTCGHSVTRIKLGGRSTFFCEECQPE